MPTTMTTTPRTQCKLFVILSLSLVYFITEAMASYMTQSLVLLADSYRMLYNNVALIMCVVSYRMFRRESVTNTFGWVRIEVLGALINTIFLVALNFSLLMEFFQTLVHSSHEDSQPLHPFAILAFGLVGFFLNLLSFTLIGGYHHHEGCHLSVLGTEVKAKSYSCALSHEKKESTEVVDDDETEKPLMDRGTEENTNPDWLEANRKFFLMDATRDYVSNLLVILCACVIMIGNKNIARFIDPILCPITIFVIMGTIIPFGCFQVTFISNIVFCFLLPVKESSLILLQTIPENINIRKIEERLKREFPDIISIHDFHVWSLTKSQVIATGHILLDSPSAYKSIAPRMTAFFQKQGITSATIQPEFILTNENYQMYDCRLTCSVKNKKTCKDLTCCGEMARSMENQLNRENLLRQRLVSPNGSSNADFLPKDDINSNYHWKSSVQDLNSTHLGLPVEEYTLDQVIKCKESSL